MRSKTFVLIAFLLLAYAPAISAQRVQSIYTNLSGKQCKTTRADSTGTGSYEGLCPGVAGYRLLVQEGDLRQNVVVVNPRGKRHSLELWSVVGSSFSSLGPRAEWRVRRLRGKIVPISLIVRYNLSDPVDSTKITSYLVVSKITDGGICVTERILPSKRQNEEARIAADNATGKACLQ